MSTIKSAEEWAQSELSLVDLQCDAAIEAFCKSARDIQRNALQAAAEELKIMADEQLAIPKTIGSIHAVGLLAGRQRILKLAEEL